MSSEQNLSRETQSAQVQPAATAPTPLLGGRTAWGRLPDTVEAYVEESRYAGGDAYSLHGRTLAVFSLNAERRGRRDSDPREQG